MPFDLPEILMALAALVGFIVAALVGAIVGLIRAVRRTSA
jgi:hypothetical protein